MTELVGSASDSDLIGRWLRSFAGHLPSTVETNSGKIIDWNWLLDGSLLNTVYCQIDPDGGTADKLRDNDIFDSDGSLVRQLHNWRILHRRLAEFYERELASCILIPPTNHVRLLDKAHSGSVSASNPSSEDAEMFSCLLLLLGAAAQSEACKERFVTNLQATFDDQELARFVNLLRTVMPADIFDASSTTDSTAYDQESSLFGDGCHLVAEASLTPQAWHSMLKLRDQRDQLLVEAGELLLRLKKAQTEFAGCRLLSDGEDGSISQSQQQQQQQQQQQHAIVEVAELQSRLRRLRAERDEIADALADAEAELAELRPTAARLRDENGRLATGATSAKLLRDELDAARERLMAASRLESETDRLRDRLKAAEAARIRADEAGQAECLALRRQLAELEEALEAAQGAADKTRQQQSELARLRQSNSELTAALDSARCRLAELNRANSELEVALASGATSAASNVAAQPIRTVAGGESLADCLRLDAEAEASRAEERLAARRQLREAQSEAAELADKLAASEDRCKRLEREVELAKTAAAGRVDVDAAEIQRLTADFKRAEAKASSTQSQLEDLEQAHASLQRELASVRSDAAALRSAAVDSVDARACADKEARRLRRIADAATASAESAAKEAAAARAEADSLRAQLAELDCSNAELHELEKERLQLLSSLSLERGTAASLRDQLVQEKVRCQALISQERRQAATTGAAVAALEGRVAAMQSELEQARDRLEAEEVARRRAELALDEAEAGGGAAGGRHLQDLLCVKDRLIQLERRNAALETERSTQSASISNWRERANSAEERLSAAQDELSDLHRQLASSNVQLAGAVSAGEALKIEVDKLQSLVSEQQSRLHSLDKDHARLTADYEQLRRLHDRLATELELAHSEKQKVVAESKQRKQELKEREALIERLIGEAEGLKHLQEALQSETKDLAEDARRCVQLQADLASLSSEQSRLQAAKERSESEARGLATDLASVRRRLADREAALAEAESELTRTRDLLAKLEANERRLTGENANLAAEMRQLVAQNQDLIANRRAEDGTPSKTAEGSNSEERLLREMLGSLQKQKADLEERMLDQYRSSGHRQQASPASRRAATLASASASASASGKSTALSSGGDDDGGFPDAAESTSAKLQQLQQLIERKQSQQKQRAAQSATPVPTMPSATSSTATRRPRTGAAAQLVSNPTYQGIAQPHSAAVSSGIIQQLPPAQPPPRRESAGLPASRPFVPAVAQQPAPPPRSASAAATGGSIQQTPPPLPPTNRRHGARDDLPPPSPPTRGSSTLKR